jgi:hypothetical protein
LTQSVVSSLVTLTWLPTALGCQPSEYVVTAGSRTGSADLAALVVATNELRVNAPDGDYFVRVVSLNKNGPSAASNEVLVTVRGSEPPGGIDILPESVAVNGASIKGLIKNNSRVRWPTVQVVGTNRRTGITATPFVYGRARRTINGLISLTSLGPGEVACFESIVLPGSVPEEYDFRVITAAPTPLWELSNTVTSSLSIEPVSLQVNISGLNSSISNAIASEVDIAFYSLDATGKTIDCFAARIGSLEPGMSKAVAFPPRLTPIAMVHWPRWIE